MQLKQRDEFRGSRLTCKIHPDLTLIFLITSYIHPYTHRERESKTVCIYETPSPWW